jgi:hypothetical protein
MPQLTMWFVRSALLHLVIGFTFGALMLANKGVAFYPFLWRLRSAHIEILLVGWIIQLAMGVAFWILPRFWEAPARGDERGAYIAFGLINLGVWLVSLSTIFALPTLLFFLGRLAEAGAALAFAIHVWPRIVSREG